MNTPSSERFPSFHMHHLPFGAEMTETLFRIAQRHPSRANPVTDYVRSIEWAPQSCAVPGKAGWLLSIIPKTHAEPERVFNVDGVSFHIAVEVEPLVRDQVFDWDDTKGVVSQNA